MTLNYVTLVLDLYDGQGNPVISGTAALTPSVQLTDVADQQLITQAPVPGSFRTGGFPQVKLLATDNGALAPSGWGWTISFDDVPGSPASFSFFLPYTGGSTQYLSSLSPVSTAVTQYPLNPMTTLGDIAYENAVPTPTRLPGNTSATKNFLTQAGTGSVSAAPAWGTIAAGDLPAATTSVQGAVILDGTAGDIAASPGTAAAGNKGQAADAKHVHPQPSMFAPTGLPGAVAASRYVGATTGGPPATGTFAVGDFAADQSGMIWVCVTAGTPGTWVATARDLNEMFLAPAGATGETCQRSIATGTSSAALVSGTVYMRAIGLNAGIAINNITLCTAAGNVATQADITHGWYALCDNTRKVVAISSDQVAVAVWTTINTAYTLAVLGAGSTTYTTTYSGLYYIAQMVAVSAANMPQFATSGSAGVGVLGITPQPWGSSSTGQTTPPATGTTLAALSSTGPNSNVFYAYTS